MLYEADAQNPEILLHSQLFCVAFVRAPVRLCIHVDVGKVDQCQG